MNSSRNKIFYFLFLLVIITSAAIIFNNLSASHVRIWDEARVAENALEILRSGEWVVIQYGGKPDLWSLKPPLATWLTAISFKIFGINECSLRLWSALFGIGTVAIVFLFGSEIKNEFVGLYAALILLSIKGFIGYHGARTGDRDVMVTFFIILSLYLFYIGRRDKHLLLPVGAVIAVALGFMTKWIALSALVIMGIYLIYFKSLKEAVFSKQAGYSAIAFLGISAPWHILRFIKGRDFFITKIRYDIIKRAVTAIEGHSGNWYYYFSALYKDMGGILLSLFVISFFYSMYLFKKKNKSIAILIFWISFFFLMLSFIQTKLPWYIIPIYPAIGLLIAYNIEMLQESLKMKRWIILLLFLMLMYFPLSSLIRYTKHIHVNPRITAIKQIKAALGDVTGIYIHEDENNQAIFFYLNAYTKGSAHLYKDFNDFTPRKGDAVITFDSDRLSTLTKRYSGRLTTGSSGLALFKNI